MSNELVTDSAVEKALDFLRDNAVREGEAARDAALTEELIKITKAHKMSEHPSLSVSAQEREALITPEYLKAAQEKADAAGRLVTMRGLREAAKSKIDVWRTSSANYRNMM
jgi:hypothetical protein